MSAYRTFLADLFRRLGWRFPLLLVWTVVVGFSEGLSIVLLLPILDRIGVSIAGGQSFVVDALDRGLGYVGANSTGQILAAVIAVATLQMALALALNFWAVRIARNYQAQRQLELFAAFMRAKWLFLTDRKAGEMTNAIITECERLGRAFTLSLSLLSSAIIAVIFVALSAVVTWQATLTIIGLAVVSGLGMFQMYGKTFAAGGRLAPLNAQLQSLLDQCFAGAKLIKASDSVDRVMGQVRRVVHELAEVNIITTVMPGVARGVIEYVALVGIAVILVLATAAFGLAPANVVVVVALFGRLFPRITIVQSQLHSLNNNVHAIEVVNDLQSAAEGAAERHDVSGAQIRVDALHAHESRCDRARSEARRVQSAARY